MVDIERDIMACIEMNREQIAKYLHLLGIVKELELEELDVTPYTSIYGPYLEIQYSSYNSEEILKKVMRFILPRVGRLDKKFDEESGKLILSTIYKDAVISIELKNPSTCRIEAVKEEVTIPAQSERKEIRTTYKLIGKCNPLMAEEENDSETTTD